MNILCNLYKKIYSFDSGELGIMIQYRREKNKHMDEIHNSYGFSVINEGAGGKGKGK